MSLKQKNFFILILSFILILGLLWYFLPLFRPTVLDIYTTSTSTTVNLVDLKTKLQEKIQIKVHLIAQINSKSELESLTANLGQSEVAKLDLEENQRQLVIQKYFPSKFLAYLKEKSQAPADANWPKYALYVGLNPQQIQKKADQEGKKLLQAETENFEKNIKNKLGNNPTLPAIFINNQFYTGSTDAFSLSAAVVKPILRGHKKELKETPQLELFSQSLIIKSPFSRKSINGLTECYDDSHCNENPGRDGYCLNQNTNNAFCQYKTPEQADLVVVTDQKCVSCHAEEGIANLKQYVKGLKSKTIEASSTEGQSLIKNYQIKTLPVFIFDSNVDKTRYFDQYVQSQTLVALSDNHYAFTQVVPRQYLERERQEKSLHFFTSSFTETSVLIENKLLPLARDGKINLVLNYIPSQIETETQENTRQVVIQNNYPDQFLTYLEKRNQALLNGEDDWKKAAQEAGLDSAKIELVKGDELYQENLKLTSEFKVSQSPVFLWENQQIIDNLDDLRKVINF